MLPVNILACRYDRLVYVRTLKCASSFYYGNLTTNYGWYPISYQDIDWEHDHVFSHIMDPMTRNLKGKLEYLIMTSQADLLQNPAFLEFVREICFFDEHSVSYQDIYGDHCREIDWILLKEQPVLDDRPKHIRCDEDFEILSMYLRAQREYWRQSIRHTEILINHFASDHPLFDRWNQLFARPADDRMLALFRMLKEDNLRRDLVQSQLGSYLSADIELYQLVVEKFNPHGETWPEITWLK